MLWALSISILSFKAMVQLLPFCKSAAAAAATATPFLCPGHSIDQHHALLGSSRANGPVKLETKLSIRRSHAVRVAGGTGGKDPHRATSHGNTRFDPMAVMVETVEVL
jgi:hypothetical protein